MGPLQSADNLRWIHDARGWRADVWRLHASLQKPPPNPRRRHIREVSLVEHIVPFPEVHFLTLFYV